MTDRRHSDPAFSDRDERKREVARTLRAEQSHDDRGWAYDLQAATVGCSETYLRRCADPRAAEHATLSVADAMVLPLETRLALARLIAGPAYQVIEEPELGESLGDDLALVQSALKEHGDAIAVLMGAVRAGAITRSVGSDLERECDEAIRPLLRAREIGKLAQREGVIGLRAVEGGRRP